MRKGKSFVQRICFHPSWKFCDPRKGTKKVKKVWEGEAVFQKWKVTCRWCSNSPSFSFTLRPVYFSSGGSCINKDGTGVLWGIQGKVTKTKLSQKFSKKFRAAKCIQKVKYISFLKSGGNYSKQTSAWQCLLLLWEYKCLAAWWPRMRTPPFLTWGLRHVAETQNKAS